MFRIIFYRFIAPNFLCHIIISLLSTWWNVYFSKIFSIVWTFMLVSSSAYHTKTIEWKRKKELQVVQIWMDFGYTSRYLESTTTKFTIHFCLFIILLTIALFVRVILNVGPFELRQYSNHGLFFSTNNAFKERYYSEWKKVEFFSGTAI